MSKSKSVLAREIRIELLRAQAAVQRGELCRQVRTLSDEMHPAHLVQSLTSMGKGSVIARLGRLALSSSSRYPMLVSLLSAAVGGVGGKGMRLGALGLIGWRLAKLWVRRSARQHQQKRSERVIGPYS